MEKNFDPIKFATILRLLRVDLQRFSGRKKAKNLAYLLTLLGVDLGIKLKDFRWYLHGPYHPEVTEFLHVVGAYYERKCQKLVG